MFPFLSMAVDERTRVEIQCSPCLVPTHGQIYFAALLLSPHPYMSKVGQHNVSSYYVRVVYRCVTS